MRTLLRSKALFAALAISAALMAAGWISNAVSRPKCTQPIAIWLFKDYLGGRRFYLPIQDETEDVRAAFQAVGATYEVAPARGRSPGKWPCLSVQTNTLVPFFISVDYFWEREAEIGGGATRRFFCFFGEVFELGDTSKFST